MIFPRHLVQAMTRFCNLSKKTGLWEKDSVTLTCIFSCPPFSTEYPQTPRHLLHLECYVQRLTLFTFFPAFNSSFFSSFDFSFQATKTIAP